MIYIFLRTDEKCPGLFRLFLDALMDWGSTSGMKFNAKKYNIMRVSRSRKPLQHFYSLGNEILQEVSDANYLGIQIDNKLEWNKHISTVAARGQSKLAFLKRNLKGCPKKLRDTAYISLIRPALEYSCSICHPHCNCLCLVILSDYCQCIHVDL